MEHLDKIIDFVFDEGDGLYDEKDREYIEKSVKLHDSYGTLMIIWDKKGIVALARWNWVDAEEAHVLDTIARRDCRNRKSMRYLVAFAKSKFPTLRRIKFERLHKYKNRAPVTYDVDSFIGKRRS